MLRLKVDALRLQRPVIDAGVDIQLGQALIDVIGPRLAPFLQERRAVPPAHLLAEAPRPYLAHRQHALPVGPWPSDRQRDVAGKSVSVRVTLRGRRHSNKKTQNHTE